jgi:hypothetical protein
MNLRNQADVPPNRRSFSHRYPGRFKLRQHVQWLPAATDWAARTGAEGPPNLTVVPHRHFQPSEGTVSPIVAYRRHHSRHPSSVGWRSRAALLTPAAGEEGLWAPGVNSAVSSVARLTGLAAVAGHRWAQSWTPTLARATRRRPTLGRPEQPRVEGRQSVGAAPTLLIAPAPCTAEQSRPRVRTPPRQRSATLCEEGSL